ncbi:MAG TPA: hypothetical protein DCP51_03290 [Clostridiales bacterium]|nr:MAG: hypothetical protein A2Y40_06420 [Candidatus Margulisbacteria bacterium GWF2_35_9]HAN20690.1 hypothetical protein [Clostridiales bacterium]
MKRFISYLLCFTILLSLSLNVSAVYTDVNNMRSIPPETTVAELKSLLKSVKSVSDGIAVLLDNVKIGTGYDVFCNDGTYKAVVLADVNGDANVSAFDYLMIKRAFLGTYTLNGVYKLAADTDEDGAINSLDYLTVKRQVLGTYTIGSKENAKSVPVLLYHHILPDIDKASDKWKNNEITISTTEFRKHMELIRDSGYTIISTDELIAYIKGERTIPEKSVVLNFDDGYKSNTEYAAPILREFGYQATIFSVIQPFFGNFELHYNFDSLQHLTEQDLTNNSDVFTQECHTYLNHEHLSQQSYSYVYNDLMQSQNAYPSKYFAYPYGDFDADVIKAVKAAGLKAAFTIVGRDVVIGENLYEIPRYMVTSPMSNQDFLKYLN